jgi:hypothetical protein
MTRNLQEIRAQMNRLVEDASMNMIESNTIKAYVVCLEIGDKVYYAYWNDYNYAYDKTPYILGGVAFFETEERARECLWNIAGDLGLRDDDGNVLENMLKVKEVTMTY